MSKRKSFNGQVDRIFGSSLYSGYTKLKTKKKSLKGEGQILNTIKYNIFHVEHLQTEYI